MVITLDSNFNIVNTSDEMIVQGSDNYDSLILKVPIENNNYFPTATFMRADGRTFGPYIAQDQIAEEENRCYTWVLTNNLLAVNGVLQVTFNINFTNADGNIIRKKNVIEVFANVYDAVIVDDVILIGGEDAVQNITEQLKLLQMQLDKYKNLWEAKVNVQSDNGSYQIINSDTGIHLKAANVGSLKITNDNLTYKVAHSADDYVSLEAGYLDGSDRKIRLTADKLVKKSPNSSTESELIDDSMIITNFNFMN